MNSIWVYFFLSILISLSVGVLLSGFLYSFSFSFKKNQKVDTLLFILRSFSVAIVVLLLFNPLIPLHKRVLKKPILYFAYDNSSSMRSLNDSIKLDRVFKTLDNQKMKLSSRYDIKDLFFDTDVRELSSADFNGSATNIAGALEYIQNQTDQNIGGVVLVSDGNFNMGVNPSYMVNQLGFPVFSCIVGDTATKRSISITNVYHNQLGFINEKFPIEVDLKYTSPDIDTTVHVNVFEDGKLVSNKKIKILKGQQREKVKHMIEPSKVGLHKYKVKIGVNEYHFFVEIKENKVNVLILYHGVHPDVGVIRSALESGKRYKVDLVEADEFKGNFEKYNIVIMHQIPSGNFIEDAWFVNVVKNKIPFLLIVGPKSNIATFNQVDLGLQIKGHKRNFEDASAIFNPSFSYFTIDEELMEDIDLFPPLDVPFGNYSNLKGQPLLNQSILGMETGRSLWFFTEHPFRKSVLLGTGIWKWSMYSYRMTGSNEPVYNMIRSAIKYLSLDEPVRRFRVEHKNYFNTYETIEISATWLNDNSEAVSTFPAELEIIDSTGKIFKFSFVSSGNKYIAKPGVLGPGIYETIGKLNIPDTTFTDSGRFMVVDIRLENYIDNANDDIMISISGNERCLYDVDVDLLEEKISNESMAKPRIQVASSVEDLVNKKILLCLIVLFFVSEWVIRKYFGKI